MLPRSIKALFIFVCFTVLSVSVVTSQGPPEGKGPPDGKGGGPPKPTMEQRTGFVSLENEVWVFTEDITGGLYNLDFGPEWYRPAPCLYGPLVFNEFNDPVMVGDAVTIKFGPRVLGDFKCTAVETDENGIQTGECITVDATGKYTPRSYLTLADRLPADTGENLVVWGRLEPKADDPTTPVIERDLLRVWEINYTSGSGWQFWRNEAEPWLKTQELGCIAGGDE